MRFQTEPFAADSIRRVFIARLLKKTGRNIVSVYEIPERAYFPCYSFVISRLALTDPFECCIDSAVTNCTLWDREEQPCMDHRYAGGIQDCILYRHWGTSHQCSPVALFVAHECFTQCLVLKRHWIYLH